MQEFNSWSPDKKTSQERSSLSSGALHQGWFINVGIRLVHAKVFS
jgi:fructosamine-3-kinase